MLAPPLTLLNSRFFGEGCFPFQYRSVGKFLTTVLYTLVLRSSIKNSLTFLFFLTVSRRQWGNTFIHFKKAQGKFNHEIILMSWISIYELQRICYFGSRERHWFCIHSVSFFLSFLKKKTQIFILDTEEVHACTSLRQLPVFSEASFMYLKLFFGRMFSLGSSG